MSLKRRADPIRFIATRMDIPPLETVARQPGVSDAYRLTIAYHDGRHPDQVATLCFIQGGGTTVELSVAYRRSSDKPFVLRPQIPIERCREFAANLRALRFDALDDMPEIPWHGVDLWLLERAAGAYSHDIVLSPDGATGAHKAIVDIVGALLREAARPIAPL